MVCAQTTNVIINIPTETFQERTNKATEDRALAAAAPALWNSLPVSPRADNSLSNFKSVLETHLFKLAYEQ